MTTVVDTLVQTPISILLEGATSLLKEKVDLILNAKDDLEVLKEKLRCFHRALEVTDRKPFFSNERNKDLEGELKDVLYDAQDIIERYQTTIALCKRDKHSRTSWNKVSKPWTTLCSCFQEHVSASYNLANEIKSINQKLDRIEKHKIMVDLLGITPRDNGGKGPVHVEHDNPRETTPHMGVQPPTGREDDKKEIVKRLVSNDSIEGCKTHKGGVSIISIVGKGGIGKTTLAKMVFKETEEHFGERRWWVCVSERPNRKDLLQKILKEVRKESKEYVDSSLSDLCTQLRKELSKEKFLLVLDDVWETKWWEGEVEGTLMAGAMGSNILITSRKKYVSDMINASYMHQLPELNFQQSWDLFLKEALREGQPQEDLEIHHVRDVGESIVNKCGGLPLVIRTVGSMMRTKKTSREDWEFVENSKIWEWEMPGASSSSAEIGGDILPGLMLSYDDLPYYLKSCFVYCCIYPKDYEIERERLIMQWVAHGLIEKKESIDVEATANQYVEDLIRRCLIEENEYYYGPHLKLHDILHDLALYIGGKEYSHASTSQNTRHMSLLAVDNVEEAMGNATATTLKLRTLLTKSFPLEHLTDFKQLRVLSLRGCQMDELPKSIEDLSLLKYLDLFGSNVRWLPSSIGRLCNLETLDLSYSIVEELPKEMGELCNLRYLGLKRTVWLKFIAEGLGKLTNLRTLHRFLVCDDKGDRKGCNIRELKDLNKLKGELSIEGLSGGSVKVIDAKKAELKEKHELIEVQFNFKRQMVGNASEESALLEALEPPHKIESLEIRGYRGDRPAWYLDSNYGELRTLCLFDCRSWAAVIGIQSLAELEVRFCPTLCALPSMPLLKSLTIEYCYGLNTIGGMPALESLVVEGCERLEQVGNDYMPALKTLELSALNILMQLPARLPSLEILYLSYLPNWESTFTSMPCLREARFENYPKMRTEGLIDDLAGLQELRVFNCPSARLGWKLLEQLPNLILLGLDSRSASLVPSPLPSQVSTFLPSLKDLELKDNTSVDGVKWGRVPEWVWGLSQLQILRLYSFSEDISLGGHWQCLPKLRYLTLDDFPNLKSLVEVNNNITLQQQQQNETTCPTDAQQQQIACLSNLQKLSITSCPALHLPQELSDRLGERLYFLKLSPS